MSNWRLLPAALLWLAAASVSALDFVSEGEKQLSQNDPVKALTYLEAAMAQGSPDERLLLNLGLAYQKTGQAVEARNTFRRGADLHGPAQKTFLLNLGISYYSARDWANADAALTEALTVDPVYASALLNRANSRLSAQAWSGAAADYRAYQSAAPNNPQKAKIDQLLALLDRAAIDAKAARLAEETRVKKAADDKAAADAAAVAKQKADEEAAAAEQARQEEIMARIRDSLASASDDSKALSTGPSGVKSDAGDFTIDP